MSIEEIRKIHYTQEGIEKGKIEAAVEMLKDGETVEKVEKYLKLSRETIESLKRELFQNA